MDTNTSIANTAQPNDEKWIGLAAGLAASVVPQVIGALRRRKGFAPDAPAVAPTSVDAGDVSDADQKWVAALARVAVPAAINALPGLINAVRGKDAAVTLPATGASEEMGVEGAEPDEKWLGLAAGLAASVVPQVIGALRRRKDFAPEPAAPGPVAGNGYAAEAEPDEKWLGLAAGLAASVVPQVIGALRRRKDFAPEPAAIAPVVGNGAAAGDAADAEQQKWVAALARVAVPAAINALPGVINAIRGRKDFVTYPAPAPAPQRSIEGFTAEDEKILRAVAPAVAEAMRGSVEGRYRVAI